jgi:hypothetical protein
MSPCASTQEPRLANSWQNYDSHGLPPRSCDDMYKPHPAHDWPHPTAGQAHCWGIDKLPADAVEKYCEPGCNCGGHCADIRRGLHPRFVMCEQRWQKLSPRMREQIADSVNG